MTSTSEMLDVATSFYKNLFALEPKPDIHLDTNFWAEGELVTNEERLELEKPFSEEEIKNAIMRSYANGVPWSFIYFLSNILGAD